MCESDQGLVKFWPFFSGILDFGGGGGKGGRKKNN